MITYTPYIVATVSGGIVGAVAMSAYSTCKLAAERKRTIDAMRDKETTINSLIACRSTCDILKAKNEELLMDRANYRQAVEDRDTRIRNLETRLNDADARRISAERKAEPVNTPETEEKQGELELDAQDDREQKAEKQVFDFLSKNPGEWKTSQDISEALHINAETIISVLHLLYIKWKVAKDRNSGITLYKLEVKRPKTMEDVFRRLPKCARRFMGAMRENPKKWLSIVELSNKTRYAKNSLRVVSGAMEEIGVVVRKTKGNYSYFKLNPNFPTA